MTDDLDAWVRANRDRYTREAMIQQLRESGYDQDTIDAAMARSDAEAGGAPRPATADRAGIGTILLIVVVLACYAGAILLGFVYLGFVGLTAGSPGFVLLVYIVTMVGGAAFSAYRLYTAPATGRGPTAIGGAFVIATVVFLGLSGLCIAGLTALPR